MKIIFFNTYNQSFLSGFFLELGTVLSNRGHKILICSLKSRNQNIELPSGISIRIIKKSHKIKNYNNIFRVIKLENPDVVVSNFSFVNPAVLSSKLLKIKHNIIWFHTLKSQMNFSKRNIFIKSVFMKLSTAIITNSKELQEEVIAEYNQKRNKVYALPFTTSIHHVEAASLALQKKSDLIYIGCPGRINHDKNQNLLIDVLAVLKDERFVMVFAGKGDLSILENNPNYELYKRQIIYLGNLTAYEMVDFYKKMDVVVLPSLNESFGLVLIEALASGSKTLVSHRFGALDYINTDTSHFTFDPKDPKDLSHKILRILSSDFDKKTFEELYFSFFSMDKIARQFENIINIEPNTNS